VLNNGGATVDASALSFDHAVPLEPITVDRIEVLRGPALQYGGSAVGGVVNVIDNRIPREALDGVTGKVDLGLASGKRTQRGGHGGGRQRTLRPACGWVQARTGRRQRAHQPDLRKDRRQPAGAAASATRPATPRAGPWAAACSGTMATWAPVSTYQTTYGTVAEDNVTIGMRSNRYALEGEWRHPMAFMSRSRPSSAIPTTPHRIRVGRGGHPLHQPGQ
jgi:iron complex outermembrane receptor protein